MADLLMTQVLPAVESLSPGELLTQYATIRALRTKVREREKQMTEQLEALGARLMQTMRDLDQESFSARGFVAYQSELTSVSVEDPVEFADYIRQTGDFSLMDLRPSKEAVLNYIDHHKTTPPGVRVTRLVRVNVRKG